MEFVICVETRATKDKELYLPGLLVSSDVDETDFQQCREWCQKQNAKRGPFRYYIVNEEASKSLQNVKKIHYR